MTQLSHRTLLVSVLLKFVSLFCYQLSTQSLGASMTLTDHYRGSDRIRSRRNNSLVGSDGYIAKVSCGTHRGRGS